MKEIVERLLASGLEELAGLSLSGTIPIRQEWINEALKEALCCPPGASTADAPALPGAKPAPPVAQWLSYVRQAEVEAQEGKLTLRFEIKIDPPTRA